MQIIAAENGRSVLNLARGEELFTTLLPYLRTQGIQGATITGLGATDHLKLAYYNLAAKTYEHHMVDEEVEILSLTGNVGIVHGEAMMHIHGVFGRKDLSTFGGHLLSLRVSGACEIHLAAFASPFMRQKDEVTGLNLLCGIEANK